MPLAGIRVLELTSVLGGPLAARILADLGAEVIKIEQPGAGDASRRLGPYFLNGESAYFLGFNRNKKSVTLNLRAEDGLEAFYRLVRVSDVVLDNFRPAVLDRLKIDHATLRAINPRIICSSLSGFGQEGPYRDRPAFDGVVQAMSGAMSVTGVSGGDPMYLGFPMGDVGGGWGTALGTLAALFARERTGESQRVGVSMIDMLVSFQAHLGQMYLASGEVPEPIGSGHPSNIPAKAFRAKDGTWVQVHCSTEPFLFKLVELVSACVPGFEALAGDERFKTAGGRMAHRSELESLLADAIVTKSADDWAALFIDWDVPAVPINNIAEALADPQVQARSMVVEIDHPTAGTFKTAGNPIKLGQEERFSPPPTLGEHTREVLREIANFGNDEIDAMEARGAI
jgi:crotonobetainyl-CoA:carnitine CoA-transferase CaiB-like acyl-CoA transferase